MFIPERSRRVWKLVVPVFALRVGGVLFSLATVLLVILAADYAHVLAKLAENKRLQGENFKLRQEMQVIRNKVETMENTVERVRNYAKKLQLLTGQDKGDLSNDMPVGPTGTGDGEERIERAPAGRRGRRARASTPTLSPGSPVGGDNASPQEDSGWNSGSLDPEGGSNGMGVVAPGARQVATVERAIPQRMERLQRVSIATEQALLTLQGYLSAQRAIIAATPSLWPIAGWLSSSFGYRRNPYDGSFRLHAGVDIAAEPGTPVRAPAGGYVIFSGQREGYGKVVVLDHGYGIRTLFAHNRQLYAAPGNRVRRGETIAEVGSTGHSTGPHLHYEIRKNGVPVNPLTFLSRTRF